MKQEEIKKKLKKWKIILFISILPIIGYIIFGISAVIMGRACFFVCDNGITGFFLALTSLFFVSALFVIPIILEILDIILLIISIFKIKKYKKLLNK